MIRALRAGRRVSHSTLTGAEAVPVTGKGCGRHPTHGTTQPHIAPTSERDMSDGSRPEQSPKVFCSCNAASEAKGDGCSAIACRNGRAQQKRTWCKRRLVSQYVPTQRLSSNSSAHSRPHPLGIDRGGVLPPHGDRPLDAGPAEDTGTGQAYRTRQHVSTSRRAKRWAQESHRREHPAG